jgi:CPA2 family monovalent cation:H+ antiporter-2
MRDAFAVLFFVSVGMLLDPASLVEGPGLLVATLAVVMVGKPLVALALVRLMRFPFRVALAVAIALGQIGEFSFILASIGEDLGVLDGAARNAIVAVAIVSIVLNPVLYRLIPSIEAWARRRPRLWRLLQPAEPAPDAVEADARSPARHRAVVIGYGPTGRTVVRLLRDNDIDPVVIDLNADSTRLVREHGVPAVHGDATRPETLEAARVAEASSLILTSAGMEHSDEVIRTARRLNPDLHVMARSTYLRGLDPLERAGADVVFSGEGEVALAFTEALLRRLGATADQVDRERARVHRDLFGEAPTVRTPTRDPR